MKPLSKEERAKLVEFLGDGTDDRCFLNQWWAQKVIADGAYWREAVKNARGVHCPFCRPEVTVDAFWQDKKTGPVGHAADCPYLIAQGE